MKMPFQCILVPVGSYSLDVRSVPCTMAQAVPGSLTKQALLDQLQAQRAQYMEQLETLKRILEKQVELTGKNPLRKEMVLVRMLCPSDSLPHRQAPFPAARFRCSRRSPGVQFVPQVRHLRSPGCGESSAARRSQWSLWSYTPHGLCILAHRPVLTRAPCVRQMAREEAARLAAKSSAAPRAPAVSRAAAERGGGEKDELSPEVGPCPPPPPARRR